MIAAPLLIHTPCHPENEPRPHKSHSIIAIVDGVSVIISTPAESAVYALVFNTMKWREHERQLQTTMFVLILLYGIGFILIQHH